MSPERDDAPLVAFAEHRNQALLEIDVAEVEVDELAHPEASGVHRVKHRAVTNAVGLATGRRLQESQHLLSIQDVRKLRKQARAFEKLRRIELMPTFLHEESEEAPNRAESARLGPSAQGLLRQRNQKSGDGRLIRFVQDERLTSEPVAEFREV